jgi:hypothetical protein
MAGMMIGGRTGIEQKVYKIFEFGKKRITSTVFCLCTKTY